MPCFKRDHNPITRSLTMLSLSSQVMGTPGGLAAQFYCTAMARARFPSKPGSAWSIQTYYRCTVSLTTSARSTSSCTEHPRGARQLVSESCTSAVYVCYVRSFYVNLSPNLLGLVHKLTTPSMAALLHASVDVEPIRDTHCCGPNLYVPCVYLLYFS